MLVTPWIALFGAVSDGQLQTFTDTRLPESGCNAVGKKQNALLQLSAEGTLHNNSPV